MTICIPGRGSFASQHGTYVQKRNKNIWRSQSYATLQNELLKKKLLLGGGTVFQFYSGKAFPIFETFTEKNHGTNRKVSWCFCSPFSDLLFFQARFQVSNIQNSPWKSLVQWRFHIEWLYEIIEKYINIIVPYISYPTSFNSMSKKGSTSTMSTCHSLPIQLTGPTSGQRLHSLPQRAKAMGGYWWHGSGSDSAATLLTVTSVCFFWGRKKNKQITKDVFFVERKNSPPSKCGVVDFICLKLQQPRLRALHPPKIATGTLDRIESTDVRWIHPPKWLRWYTPRGRSSSATTSPSVFGFFVGGWCVKGLERLGCLFLGMWLWVCVCVFDIWSTKFINWHLCHCHEGTKSYFHWLPWVEGCSFRWLFWTFEK